MAEILFMEEMEFPTEDKVDEAEITMSKRRHAINQAAKAVPPAALQPVSYIAMVRAAASPTGKNSDSAALTTLRVGLLQDLVGSIAMWYRLTDNNDDFDALLRMRKVWDLTVDATWAWCHMRKIDPEWAALVHLLRTVKQCVNHTEHASSVLARALEDSEDLNHQYPIPPLV